MSRPMKTINRGRDVVVTKEIWEDLGRRQIDDKFKIEELGTQLTEALGTCRELAQDNDKLEEKLEMERKLSATKIEGLESELEAANESLKVERWRSKIIVEAFGDVARSMEGVSLLSRNMTRMIDDADLRLTPHVKEKVTPR